MKGCLQHVSILPVSTALKKMSLPLLAIITCLQVFGDDRVLMGPIFYRSYVISAAVDSSV